MRYPFSRLPQALLAFVSVTVILPLLVAGVTLTAYGYLPLSAPKLPEPSPGMESRITRIYDGTGQEIGALRNFETKIDVSPADVPEILKRAVVAAEDKRFYSHRGFDLKAALRALWADLRGRSIEEGGSTITQQYVKNTYTSGERTLGRKLKEALIASRIDRKLDKDEILYRYLSSIYLGGGAYGVGAAAESYFKKRVKDLTLSESALLAGLIPAPSKLEPRGHPVEAEAARVRVLGAMLEQGRINQGQHDEAVAQRIINVGVDPVRERPATDVHPLELRAATRPYFVDAVRRYLSARYGDDAIYRGGLRVETSLDPRLQDLAEDQVERALSGTHPPLEMALVAIEPNTGYVKALVGGRDFSASQVNLALGSCAEKPSPPDRPLCLSGGGTGRQSGSAFKPITLATAFERGIGPSRVYSAPSSYRFPGCRGECTVHNVESGGYGAISLRQATAYSVNTVYAQLALDVGVPETAEMANRLGLTMVNPDGTRNDGGTYGAALTLGAAETSPWEMAAAFAVFANRGLQQPATPVVKVTDAHGNVLEDNTRREGRRVLSEDVADNVNDVLKDVVQYGTGTAADIGRPNGTAGKTGTSEDFGDAWFVGYTPALSTAVWMGYSDSRQRPLANVKGVSRVYGGTIPARTWSSFMRGALQDAPLADFAPPAPLPGDIAPPPPPAPEPTPPLPPTPTTARPPVVIVGPSPPDIRIIWPPFPTPTVPTPTLPPWATQPPTPVFPMPTIPGRSFGFP